MDLRRFAPKLFQSDEEVEDRELTPEEEREARLEKRRRAPKHGPYGVGGARSVRWLTNGQVRRMHLRDTKSMRRKATKRFRREWYQNETAFHRLRSQIELIDNRPESALVPGVVRVLEERYESVDKAREHLVALQAERVARSAA